MYIRVFDKLIWCTVGPNSLSNFTSLNSCPVIACLLHIYINPLFYFLVVVTILFLYYMYVYCCYCFFMSNITFQHAFETSQNIKTMEQKLLDFKMNPQKHLHLLNLNLLPRIQQLVHVLLFFPIIPIRSVCSPSLAELS